MDDIKSALLGDKETSKSLTNAGMLIPYHKCGGSGEVLEVKAT